MRVEVEINGGTVTRDVEPRLTLADLLRTELGLTGTKLGCEHGVCGACTVLLDGKAVRSCLTLAVQVSGRAVTTVEALASDRSLNPLQQSFRRHHALQCGFCTAGFLMAATELLADTPAPTEDQVREAIGGNICRCTGYAPIVTAIAKAYSDDPNDTARSRDA
jgi:carbon-monoxide dehydrogenase small subunit